MDVLILVLLVLAAVLFFLSFCWMPEPPRPRWNLIAGGLLAWEVAYLIQFMQHANFH